MRKKILWIMTPVCMLLVVILLSSALSQSVGNENENSGGKDLSELSVALGDITESQEETDFGVASIVCTPEANDVALCVCETFFEDENYSYYFGYPISQYVIVTYTDGSTENVKEALKKEHITIADLDTYEIAYYADPKHIHQILDETEIGEYVAENTPEEFYRDEEYIYCFPTAKSEHVMVWYWNDPKQNVKEALSQGKIRITDLDYHGIEYYKKPLPENG